MAVTSKELRERRAPLAKKIRDFADLIEREKRDFNSEEQAAYKQVNDDYNQLSRQIELVERAELVEKEQTDPVDERPIGRHDAGGPKKRDKEDPDQPKVTEEHHALAIQAWCRHKVGVELRKKHVEACRLTGINPRQRDLKLRFAPRAPRNLREACARYAPQSRALSAVSGAAGQYLIEPEGFTGALELALLQFGGMRNVAEVMRTSTGAEISIPTSDDTSNKGALLSENTTVSEQDITVGQISWKAWKYTSKLVKVPYELIEDSAFDLATLLGAMLGERIGRITNQHFTTGDGANKPRGIVTASVLGVTAASATAIAADEVFDLYHKIDPAYRGPGFGFMCHDNTLLALRKLKDGNGQYLWTPGLSMGEPDRLIGQPVQINQDMDSTIASGKKSLLAGQLRLYKIRDVGSFRLRRLVERYADADQEGFVAFSRHDGNLLDAGTNPVKHLVH